MRVHLTVKLCVLFLIGLEVTPKVDSSKCLLWANSDDIHHQSSSNNQQQVNTPGRCHGPASRGYVPLPGIGYVRPGTVAKTWLQAAAECAADGATLPLPRSHAAAAVLADVMDFSGPGATSADWAWLGATDLEEEGKWVTAEGFLVDHASTMTWFPGEPNLKREENCMVFNKKTATKGNAPCLWKAAFVCYIPFNQ